MHEAAPGQYVTNDFPVLSAGPSYVMVRAEGGHGECRAAEFPSSRRRRKQVTEAPWNLAGLVVFAVNGEDTVAGDRVVVGRDGAVANGHDGVVDRLGTRDADEPAVLRVTDRPSHHRERTVADVVVGGELLEFV